MSAFVYCLYSTEDGVPRYVGRADDKVSYRFKQHITAALEKEPGALYDWMRDVWRQGQDIGVFSLQEGIMPKDHAMFEQYWIDQFGGLLNLIGNRGDKSNSAVAQQVIAAIQSQLELGRRSAPPTSN
jgi:hypothetical protein